MRKRKSHTIINTPTRDGSTILGLMIENDPDCVLLTKFDGPKITGKSDPNIYVDAVVKQWGGISTFGGRIYKIIHKGGRIKIFINSIEPLDN